MALKGALVVKKEIVEFNHPGDEQQR